MIVPLAMMLRNLQHIESMFSHNQNPVKSRGIFNGMPVNYIQVFMNIPQLFIHSPVVGYLGCCQVFVITIHAEVNVLTAVCFCTCAEFV